MRRLLYRTCLCLPPLLLAGVAHAHGAGRVAGTPGSTAVPTTRASALVVGGQAIAVDERRGRVFVLTSGGTQARGVSVLNATTGALLRTIRVFGYDGLAVDERTGHVFVADWARSAHDQVPVRMIDEGSGAVLRTITVGENPTAVTVDETTERVFVTNRYSVSVLAARTGALLRTVPEGGVSFTPVAVDQRTGHAFAVSTWFNMLGQPVPGANTVSMLDTTSGALLRRVPDLHGPLAVAVDQRSGRVFAANTDGTVSILDARGGSLLRTVVAAPHSVANGAAVDEQTGRIFVTSYDRTWRGHLSVLDAQTGALLMTSAASLFSVLAVSERTGRVFVTVSSGVRMLDATSGRVVRTVVVGPSPSALAVDERLGRVFVSTNTGVSMLDARRGVLLQTTVIRS